MALVNNKLETKNGYSLCELVNENNEVVGYDIQPGNKQFNRFSREEAFATFKSITDDNVPNVEPDETDSPSFNM